MTSVQAEIRLQSPRDYPALKRLNEKTFGPGRFARTAYRLREAALPDPRLSFCAAWNGEIIGSVQFTPVTIGGVSSALLLGPLIIKEERANQGYGLRLMLDGLKQAADLGYKLVILVGDLPYYARAGFAVVPAQRIFLPGPVDPARLLYVELIPHALSLYYGPVRGLQI